MDVSDEEEGETSMVGGFAFANFTALQRGSGDDGRSELATGSPPRKVHRAPVKAPVNVEGSDSVTETEGSGEEGPGRAETSEDRAGSSGASGGLKVVVPGMRRRMVRRPSAGRNTSSEEEDKAIEALKVKEEEAERGLRPGDQLLLTQGAAGLVSGASTSCSCFFVSSFLVSVWKTYLPSDLQGHLPCLPGDEPQLGVVNAKFSSYAPLASPPVLDCTPRERAEFEVC